MSQLTKIETERLSEQIGEMAIEKGTPINWSCNEYHWWYPEKWEWLKKDVLKEWENRNG